MAFSTSGPVRAWRFEDLEPQIMAQMLGCPVKEAKSQLAKLKKQHADPVWIEDTLARLSVPALGVLAVLAANDGVVDEDELLHTLRSRFGVRIEQIEPAIHELIRNVLVVTLASGGRHTRFALVAPSAERIAPRVRDLDMPVVIPSQFVASDDADGGRAFLAACCALRHVDLKLTQQGLPHRAGIKRIAKTVGIGEDKLAALVELGMALHLFDVRDDDGLLQPSTTRMLAAAKGRFDVLVVAAFCEQLHEHGPVTLDRAERWSDDAASSFSDRLRLDQLGSLPGIQAGSLGTAKALRAVAPGGIAAASVTPSFEVFLPPESRLEHVVQVLGCAELVRIDRVIVGRITKASVQRAIAAGERTESIVLALAAASRTPIPQNVEVAIADWAAGAVHAIMAVGRVVIVPLSHEDRALSVLETMRPKRLAPGVIVLAAATPGRAVAALLSTIGVHERKSAGGDHDRDFDRDDDRDDDRYGPQVSKPPKSRHVPTLAGADPILQQRVAAFRANDPAEQARAPSAKPHGNGAAGGAANDDTGYDDDAPAIECSEKSIALVEDWEYEHGMLSDEVATTTAVLLDTISDADRKFVLGARTPKQLDSRIREVLVNRGGLQRFFEKHEELADKILPPEVAAAIRSTPKGSLVRELVELTSPSPSETRSPSAGAAVAPVLEWHSDDLRARLAEAARAGAICVVDLGNARHVIRIVRLLPRGSVTMVLGEDPEDDSAVALPLSAILRIAKMPPTARRARRARRARPDGSRLPAKPCRPATCPVRAVAAPSTAPAVATIETDARGCPDRDGSTPKSIGLTSGGPTMALRSKRLLGRGWLGRLSGGRRNERVSSAAMTSDRQTRFLDRTEIERGIAEVAELANAQATRVALIGGAAMQLFGSPRFTKNLDFIADRILDGLTP